MGPASSTAGWSRAPWTRRSACSTWYAFPAVTAQILVASGPRTDQHRASDPRLAGRTRARRLHVDASISDGDEASPKAGRHPASSAEHFDVRPRAALRPALGSGPEHLVDASHSRLEDGGGPRTVEGTFGARSGVVRAAWTSPGRRRATLRIESSTSSAPPTCNGPGARARAARAAPGRGRRPGRVNGSRRRRSAVVSRKPLLRAGSAPRRSVTS